MMEIHDSKCRSCLHTEIANFSLKRSSVRWIFAEIQVTYFFFSSLWLTFLSSVLKRNRAIASGFQVYADRHTDTHIRKDSSDRVISPSQGPVPTQHT